MYSTVKKKIYIKKWIEEKYHIPSKIHYQFDFYSIRNQDAHHLFIGSFFDSVEAQMFARRRR